MSFHALQNIALIIPTILTILTIVPTLPTVTVSQPRKE